MMYVCIYSIGVGSDNTYGYRGFGIGVGSICMNVWDSIRDYSHSTLMKI